MSSMLWSTRAPLTPEFERAWNQRLACMPHAHFAVDLPFLTDEARHGRHALAVLVEDDGRRGAIVLRESGTELVSGWPWRWQALIENGSGPPARGMSVEEGEWLWSRAQELSGGRRLRFHLPSPAVNGTPWFVAGHTFVQSLERSEDDLWKGLDGAKRRMTKKARNQGYTVVEARDPEMLRAFSLLPRENQTDTRPPVAYDGDLPPPGEGFREWELPWMCLLVAIKDGVVEAGSGFGLKPGGTMDYRTNASSVVAKKDGANVLLAWEAMRIGRERGYRWLNWGGATRFKQEFGGDRIEVDCRLGGGAVWWLPNLVDVSSRRARVRIGAWRRSAKRAAKSRTGAAASTPKPAREEASLSLWRTREPIDPAFAMAWKELVARAPRANFGLDLDFMTWEARHGRHGLAAIAQGDGRRGLMVLRETREGWTCGLPWRWLAAIADPDERDAPTMTSAEAAWLFQQAQRLVGGRRFQFYVPAPPVDGVPGFEAGATVVQSLAGTDEEILAAIHPSKRRMVKRAQSEGYQVIEGVSLEHFRTFAAIQQETFLRRGIRVEHNLDRLPEPGEDWREWELPWMWLLLATRNGRVESGLGDGLGYGGMLEGRTGASTAIARRAGAFALLCYEEARRGRDRGYRWLNHGGDTPFKREMAGALGTRVVMHCWLGGGAAWKIANRSVAWARTMRIRLPAALRSFGQKGSDPS